MTTSRRRDTLIVQLPTDGHPLSDREKVVYIKQKLRDMLQNRMEILGGEASAISSDMDALVLRLDEQGHRAEMGDIKSARWYRTVSQMKVLKELYAFVCKLTGSDEGVVDSPVVDGESHGAAEGTDDDSGEDDK